MRNPKRFREHISFLQVLTYVVASEVDEQKLVEGGKMIVPPQRVKGWDGVYISMFGGLEIYSYQGRLTDNQLKSPKTERIIAYLLLHRERAVSARELAECLWPDEVEAMIASIRSLVYRFRKTFRLICERDLIETVNGKYCINTELVVTTDLERLPFISLSIVTFAPAKKAVHLYKGSVYPDAGAEHWLMPLAADYQLRFLRAEEKLLGLLAQKGGYRTVYDEAKRALTVEKGNMLLYYWMIHSLIKQRTTESAKNAMRLAKQNLTSEDYVELVARLQQS